MVSEVNFALLVARRQKDAPAVLRHAHISEVRPAIAIHADCGSEIHLQLARIRRTGFIPPVQERWLPAFERTLQGSVVRQPYVIRYALRVIDWLLNRLGEFRHMS